MSTKIFISSTAKDLTEQRKALCETIAGLDGYEAIHMELSFGARAASPEELCRRQVTECDLLVGIIGHLFGSSPEGSDRSFTEIEYSAAQGKGIECLMFLAPDDFNVPMTLIEDDAKRAAQKAFRELVQRQRTVEFFTSPEDLAVRVVKAVKNHEPPAQKAGRGLMALTELMQEPEVREAVLRFRTEFEAACEQITVAADNKEMHDLLHALQFQCFDMLIRELRRFPDIEETMLESYEQHLEECATQLEEIAERESQRSYDDSWIADLRRAGADLRAAIAESDKQAFKKVLRRLNSVLTIQPSVINTRLSEAVRSLRLQQLVEAVRIISAKIDSGESDLERLQHLTSSVDALAKLSEELTQLTWSHDKWQGVDIAVRGVDATIAHDLEDLEAAWPRLRDRISELATETRLAQELESLDSALRGDDPAKARRFFYKVRRDVGTSFFRVDLRLKKLCGELRTVGEPLARVLEELQ